MQVVKTIDSLFYRELDIEIRNIRHNRGMTLKEVSQLTGVSRTLLDHWELGLNKITPKNFERLCKALQVTPKLDVNIKLGI